MGKKKSIAIDAETIRQRIGEERFRLLELWTKDVVVPFDAAIAKYVTWDTVLLDAGCSRGDPDLKSFRQTKQTIGCDTDMLGLRSNALERDRVQGVLHQLPFADGAFDVIVCKFVVEHLTDPLETFNEFARVLRPGGAMAVLTPNSNSLLALISRCLPERVKAVFKARLFGVHEEETFPTCYRANSPGRLDGLLREAGFETAELTLVPGMWAFFIFWVRLALFIRACERLQARVPGLCVFSAHMAGIWRKL